MRDLEFSSKLHARSTNDLPLKVALHLPTLLTRKTACGSHTSSNTSSGEKTGVVDEETFGGVRASVKMEVLICTRAASDLRGTKWKEYGNGSSSYIISTITNQLRNRTSPLSLLTSICKASRPVSAGRLIAGPRLLPSSAFLNWTTTDGMIASAGGVTRGRSDRE